MNRTQRNHGIYSPPYSIVSSCVILAFFQTCHHVFTPRGCHSWSTLSISNLVSSGSTYHPLYTIVILIHSCEQSKVLLVLYDGGKHAQEVPELLGTTENELGIRKWLEDQGHTLVTTSDKDRDGSKFDQELVDAEVIITTPYVLEKMLDVLNNQLIPILQLPSWLSNR